MKETDGRLTRSEPATLADLLWERHVVDERTEGAQLIYVDLHLVHEVSSPQAFEGLRSAGRRVRRPELTVAVEDHNVPTNGLTIRDELSQVQVQALRDNCAEHGIELHRLGDRNQGIVHVIAPELGLVQPGMTIVCGDSHTSTLGAFGALAFGIGTSDVEHVLATQTLVLPRPLRMAVHFLGALRPGVTPKDVMLALIATIGANGARGHIIEYDGAFVDELSMEGRLTICNMTVEAGATAGLIAPDETTFEYLRDRQYAPSASEWDQAVAAWRRLRTSPAAVFDRTVDFDVSRVVPYVTWGTNPGQAVPIDGVVPHTEDLADADARIAARRAMDYMDVKPGARMRDLHIDTVFLGSCTNGRIEDLRQAAEVLRGRRIAPGVQMLVVPGSMQVRRQAEAEGLHEVLERAGAQWRTPGCSMCVGLNDDRARAGERIASTSNRNYEGRQGTNARTHLVSPAVAAATAVTGRLTAPHEL